MVQPSVEAARRLGGQASQFGSCYDILSLMVRDGERDDRHAPNRYLFSPQTRLGQAGGSGLPSRASWPFEFHSTRDVTEQLATSRRYAPSPRRRLAVCDAARDAANNAEGRAQRCKLSLPATYAKIKPWAAAGEIALRHVLGVDELGLLATSLFKSALTSGTYVHYSSNLTAFFKFCNVFSLDLLEVMWTSHTTSRGLVYEAKCPRLV